jgi:hypothetical protein
MELSLHVNENPKWFCDSAWALPDFSYSHQSRAPPYVT